MLENVVHIVRAAADFLVVHIQIYWTDLLASMKWIFSMNSQNDLFTEKIFKDKYVFVRK